MTDVASILVVALDASFREAAFTVLTAADYRVDAVADTKGARQRLTKDRYALIVREAGFAELDGDGTPALEVDPAHPAASLVERVRDALAERP